MSKPQPITINFNFNGPTETKKVIREKKEVTLDQLEIDSLTSLRSYLEKKLKSGDQEAQKYITGLDLFLNKYGVKLEINQEETGDEEDDLISEVRAAEKPAPATQQENPMMAMIQGLQGMFGGNAGNMPQGMQGMFGNPNQQKKEEKTEEPTADSEEE